MSGHSKWHSIKHKKAKEDAKRGKLFTKAIKEISIAARSGGGDPDMNPRLRTAIQNAKAVNMPQQNIERAIKKGTGELPGQSYEEVTYEGYGPGGVAVFIEASTDNKNRTVGEIRHLFTKYNGNLGESGSVDWLFTTRGMISVDKSAIDEEKLLEIALEAGADDVKPEGETYDIMTDPGDFDAVKASLEQNGVAMSYAEVTKLPSNTIKVEDKEATQMLKLMEALEEHDDVDEVYANFDISEELMEQMSA